MRRKRGNSGTISAPRQTWGTLEVRGPAPAAHHRGLLLGAVICSCVAVYANSLRNQFVWDDQLQIVGNPDLRKLSYIGKAFSSPVWAFLGLHAVGFSSYYRPLQAMAYTLGYQLWGLHAWGYHVESLVFHALTTTALFLLVEELSASAEVGFGAALLFAVHPIHTEAVSWIAALPDLQCAFFYLLSMYCWARWHRTARTERGSRWWLAGACGCFFLSLLSKEMGATLPLALLLYEGFFGQDGAEQFGTRRILGGLGGVATALAGYLGLRYGALGGLRPISNEHVLTFWQYALSDLALIGQYFQKAFVPVRQSAYYVFRPSTSVWEPHVLLGIAWVTVCVAAVVMAKRWPEWLRLPLFGLAWILVTLIPVLAIRQVGYNVFAERYLYLPSAGACLALGAVLGQLPSERSKQARAASAAALLAVVALFTIQTVRRNRVWKNDFTLYQQTIQVSPDAVPMYNGLGRAYFQTGQYAEALHLHREALRAAERDGQKNPFFLASTYAGMGSALLATGKTTDAEAACRKALSYFPYPDAYLNLGVIAFQRRDFKTAYALSLEAIHALPVYDLAYSNAGAALLAMGEAGKATPYLETAVELSPRYTQARVNLAVAYRQTGQTLKAVEQMRAVLGYDPENKTALKYLERLLKVPAAGAGQPANRN